MESCLIKKNIRDPWACFYFFIFLKKSNFFETDKKDEEQSEEWNQIVTSRNFFSLFLVFPSTVRRCRCYLAPIFTLKFQEQIEMLSTTKNWEKKHQLNLRQRGQGGNSVKGPWCNGNGYRENFLDPNQAFFE